MAALASARTTTIQLQVGSAKLRLAGFEVVERLSQPFVITAQVISPLGEIDFLPHLGKPASIEVAMTDGSHARYFHALLFEAEMIEQIESGVYYQLILRPWLHYLENGRDYAIYQDLTALDIIASVFSDAGIDDVDYSGVDKSRLAKRAYCVKFRETDFHFVSRLMEEEGIFYSFQHEKSRHVLRLSNKASYPELAGGKVVNFSADSASLGSGGGNNLIWSWRERIRTSGHNRVTLRDYDFEKPTKRVEQVESVTGDNDAEKVEVYDYPGSFVEDAEGRKLSEVRLQALRSERRLFRGVTDREEFAVGSKFMLLGHPVERMDVDYAIIGQRYRSYGENYRSTSGTLAEEGLRIEFEAIVAQDVWKPPLTTPRPVARGPQSAIVTGPKGGMGKNQDLHTDKYGRVKVRFFWDRSGVDDEKSSCWLRVSQTGGLGNIIIPRVGHEVIVDFMDGNPDRPIVMGRVFNADHMPVYPLPDNATRAVWRSHTSGKSGQYEGKKLDSGEPRANEIRLEDAGGKEEFYVHAERDMNARIRNNETHNVGYNQSIVIGVDRTLDVGQDETTTIGRDRTESVGRDEKITIGKDRTEKVGANEKITIGTDRTEDVGSNETIKVGQNRKVKIGMNDTLEVGTNLKIKAGVQIDIEAGAQLTIKVGGSKITMNPAMIKIEGQILMSKSTMTQDKATLMQEEADALMMVKGAITMIN